MAKTPFSDKTLQTIIGNLLRYGVLLALTVGGIGGILYLSRHGHDVVHYEQFKENDKSLGTLFREIINGLKAGSGQAIIFAGIIILFLTPALRLVLSLFSFMAEKDYLYIAITIIVISIIGTSIYLGYAG
ncbi:hypothetical protein A8C56_01775 [Niabella ginsenosidivorans]|uniref:DUF1634 domain-containing protein n=1 Tax=Niabella ginsenosidivorans TaxID=1176587 RepID=A0A1A9HZL9_9BACT|nr:DUF1634 domain-containing protein [Niabella ginsenosidivorans]ANH79872.1 hypothetical protein A8C56_01775 [Niabella ginsenosidivorans]